MRNEAELRSANRNGGRHCCQPPLRRAKDMPVFVSLDLAPRKGWGPASRSWRTSSGVASHLTAPSGGGARPLYQTARPEGSLVFRAARPAKGQTVQCSAALLGSTTLASRFASHDPKTAGSRVALEEDRLFRRLLPAGPASAPERASALPAGGDRSLDRLPHLLAVAGLPKRLGPPSRSPDLHAPAGRVAKAKNRMRSLWITGISGTTVGTF